jgi:nucleoid-associated protein YgaU
MNTQVKVGIAAAIVAALVALIVLDQKTTPKDDATQRTSTGGDPATIVGTNQGAEPSSPRLGEDEINRILKSAEKQFGDQSQKAPGPVKGSEEKNEKRVTTTATSEDYVIKDGDTLEKIAQKHKTTATKIMEANPGLKATALRPNKSIKLPKTETAPIEKKEEAPVVVAPVPPVEATLPPKPTEPSVKSVNGQKIYTVQAGDTLSGISVKVYNTSRHYQKIYEANKDEIGDPNTLQVGLNLVMPDLPSKTTTANTGVPGTGAVATTVIATPPPAGAKSVEVKPGDRLWNIAAKFAAERKIGILEMIKVIVDANIDKKIREDGSNLQAGWQLIIPE